MKLYLTICVTIGILLGWWFVWDCQRYDDEHYRVNGPYEHWTPADWKRWKELHADRPPEER
jgi:hypothetical protein